VRPITTPQARWRGVSTRKRTKPALVERHAAVTIQRRQRGIAGRQLARTMRREKAATLIQVCVCAAHHRQVWFLFRDY
jgi:hypothetical protein